MDKELLQKRRILENQSRQGLDYVGPHRRPNTLKDALVDDRQKILAATNLARQQQRMSGAYTQIRPIILGSSGLTFIEQTTFNVIKFHDQGTVYPDTDGPAKHLLDPATFLAELGRDSIWCHFASPITSSGLLKFVFSGLTIDVTAQATGADFASDYYVNLYFGADWDPTTLTYLNAPVGYNSLANAFRVAQLSPRTTTAAPGDAITLVDQTNQTPASNSRTIVFPFTLPFAAIGIGGVTTIYGAQFIPIITPSPNLGPSTGFAQIDSIDSVSVAVT